MKRWEQGRGAIEKLLADQHLQRVMASREHAAAMLDQARRYVASAPRVYWHARIRMRATYWRTTPRGKP